MPGESPCDEGIVIEIADYEGVVDGEHHWLAARERACGQGLPPQLTETAVAPRTETTE